MTASTRLPCAADPDRWFDENQRTYALIGCLQCPARRWCAQEALRAQAAWGMWAGVWLDGSHPAQAAHLAALADETTAPARADHRGPGRCRPAPAGTPPLSVAAAVTARSSGCCEIMGPRCRLTATGLVSRVSGVPGCAAMSAAGAFAACAACATAITELPDADAVHTAGYLVTSAERAPATAFLWRQRRWVLFGVEGQLREVTAPAHNRSTEGLFAALPR